MGETKGGTLAAGDCRSPVIGTTYFADRFSFTGDKDQEIVVTVTGNEGFRPGLLLIRDYDGVWYGGTIADTVARLPSSGSFSLPYTGTFFIEVYSQNSNATGAYQVTLGSPATAFPATGRVTGSGAIGVPNVTLTFTRVTGSGALPAPVSTDVGGYWFQTGFEPGTTYRVTPSFGSEVFTPANRDFVQATALNFTTPYTPPTTSTTTTSTTTSTTSSTTTTTGRPRRRPRPRRPTTTDRRH